MQFFFGSGSMWGIRTDLAAGTATPIELGGLQDVTVDISFSLKELRGQYQLPLAIARGAEKITGKAKFANISAKAFNDLFFGQTIATGRISVAKDEVGTGATVTVSNAATYYKDLGVMYSATGVMLTRVASAPTVGQYSVVEATGVYTFNASDAALAMKLDYEYTVAATGNKITLSNQLMGHGTTFKAVLWGSFTSNGVTKSVTMELNSCIINKLAFATKLEDFVIPELDFEVQADSANNWGTLSIDEP